MGETFWEKHGRAILLLLITLGAALVLVLFFGWGQGKWSLIKLLEIVAVAVVARATKRLFLPRCSPQDFAEEIVGRDDCRSRRFFAAALASAVYYLGFFVAYALTVPVYR